MDRLACGTCGLEVTTPRLCDECGGAICAGCLTHNAPVILREDRYQYAPDNDGNTYPPISDFKHAARLHFQTLAERTRNIVASTQRENPFSVTGDLWLAFIYAAACLEGFAAQTGLTKDDPDWRSFSTALEQIKILDLSAPINKWVDRYRA